MFYLFVVIMTVMSCREREPSYNQSVFHPAIRYVLSGEGDRFSGASLSQEKLNAQNQFGRTALMYAVLLGDVTLVDTLLTQGADPHLKDNYGNSALAYAKMVTAESHHSFPFSDSLLDHVDLTAVDKSHREQLLRLRAMDTYLNKGDLKGAREWAPFCDLYLPVDGGCYFTKYLQQHDVQSSTFFLKEMRLLPTAVNKHGLSGLKLVHPDSTTMVELLLSSGVALNDTFHNGGAYATFLVQYKDSLLMERFVRKGMTLYPETLERAIRSDNRELVHYLSTRVTLTENSLLYKRVAQMDDTVILQRLINPAKIDDSLLVTYANHRYKETFRWLLGTDRRISQKRLLDASKIYQREPTLSHVVERLHDSTKIRALEKAISASNNQMAAAILTSIAALPEEAQNLPATAAAYVDTSVMRLLLKKGADINGVNRFGGRALTSAIRNRDSALFPWLVEQGACLNEKDTQGHTPIVWAAIKKRPDLVRYLLDKGVDITPFPKAAPPFLKYLVGSDKSSYIDMVETLYRRFPTVDPLICAGVISSDSAENALLTRICTYGDSAAFDLYQALCQEKNYSTDQEVLNAALLGAVSGSQETMAFKVISMGAELECQNEFAFTPLHIAVTRRMDSLTTFLIEKGAGFGLQNKHGETPLLSAAWFTTEWGENNSRNYDIVRAMIDAGAQIGFINKKGEGVLTNLNDRDFILELIERGAPVDVVYSASRVMNGSLLFDALSQRDSLLISSVITASRNINYHISGFNKSVLAYAIEREQIDAVRLLLQKGINRQHPSVVKALKTVKNPELKKLLKSHRMGMKGW